MASNKINPTHLSYARKNRKRATRPEAFLWAKLRTRQLGGYKFRRQYSVHPYIVDFVCLELMLVVEVDGDTHFTPEAKSYDAKRNKHLELQGYWVIRFTNLEVMGNLDGVLEEILRACGECKKE